MIINRDAQSLRVIRGDGARVKNESHFWYVLRNVLRSRREDWKKIRQPGALSAMPYALRLGPMRKRNRLVIDSDYAIRDPAKAFNAGETVTLRIVEAEST